MQTSYNEKKKLSFNKNQPPGYKSATTPINHHKQVPYNKNIAAKLNKHIVAMMLILNVVLLKDYVSSTLTQTRSVQLS